jgi:hypothetical protein
MIGVICGNLRNQRTIEKRIGEENEKCVILGYTPMQTRILLKYIDKIMTIDYIESRGCFMKKAKFLYVFLTGFFVALFTGCPIEGDLAILTIKNQSSLEITAIKIWRGTEALEEAKLKMAEAEFKALTNPSIDTIAEWAAAMIRYNEEIDKVCSQSPEIKDDTGLPINAIKSWEIKSGSIIVKAACGDKLSSPHILNFGGDHAIRFTGQEMTNEGDYDWE